MTRVGAQLLAVGVGFVLGFVTRIVWEYERAKLAALNRRHDSLDAQIKAQQWDVTLMRKIVLHEEARKARGEGKEWN